MHLDIVVILCVLGFTTTGKVVVVEVHAPVGETTCSFTLPPLGGTFITYGPEPEPDITVVPVGQVQLKVDGEQGADPVYVTVILSFWQTLKGFTAKVDVGLGITDTGITNGIP